MGRDGAKAGVLRLKVTLRGMRPPVWRRLLVPERLTLRELHGAIQAAMGWENSHLHLFVAGRDQSYGDPGMLDDVRSDARISVGELAARGVEKFLYVYDMGDDWEHTVAIEASEVAVPDRPLPACIGGRRACPPEDTGGVPGFLWMLETIADPSNPAAAEYREWLGAWDPEAFSLDEAEARMRTWFPAPKRRRRSVER